MKALKWIAAGSAGIGVILMSLSVFSLLLPPGKLILGFEHRVNYFDVANSFFLITIILFIYVYVGHCKKE